MQPASEDASFRRYFRLTTAERSYIVMDAPPDKEPIEPFVRIALALAKQRVHVPEIIAFDAELGFILMEDLGGVDFLDVLNEHPDQLYQTAIESLLRIQRGGFDQPQFALPDYNHQRLEDELDVFTEWYLGKQLAVSLSHDQTELWAHTKQQLTSACLEQPQVWVHRDYHSRNLMLCADGSAGVIDFQDMVLGPIAYDLVSLFKDCYIEWPREQQLGWCEQYHAQLLNDDPLPDITLDSLIRWFDLTGLQRHLKVLGVFSRLHHRDGKSQYLNDLPLVRKYILEALSLYPEFGAFEHFFRELPHD